MLFYLGETLGRVLDRLSLHKSRDFTFQVKFNNLPAAALTWVPWIWHELEPGNWCYHANNALGFRMLIVRVLVQHRSNHTVGIVVGQHILIDISGRYGGNSF